EETRAGPWPEDALAIRRRPRKDRASVTRRAARAGFGAPSHPRYALAHHDPAHRAFTLVRLARRRLVPGLSQRARAAARGRPAAARRRGAEGRGEAHARAPDRA